MERKPTNHNQKTKLNKIQEERPREKLFERREVKDISIIFLECEMATL